MTPDRALALPGLVLLASLSLLSAAAPQGTRAQEPSSSPPPCSAPEHRQFDFWLGTWEVRNPDGRVVGENTIEAILDGCVLRESYSTPSGFRGRSLNLYDASRGVWHQSWVDVTGLLLILEGGMEDGAMVLEGSTEGAEGTTRHRIRWTLVDGDPDRVRQLWESSTDGGASWSVTFDGLYVRKEGTAPLSGSPSSCSPSS